MLRTNVETYLECDRDYEEADIVLFGAPLIPALPSDREPDSGAALSAMNPLDLKATALIRTGI